MEEDRKRKKNKKKKNKQNKGNEGTVVVEEEKASSKASSDKNYSPEHEKASSDKNHSPKQEKTYSDKNHSSEHEKASSDKNHSPEHEKAFSDKSHSPEHEEASSDKNHSPEHEKASSDMNHSPEPDAPSKVSEKAFDPDNIYGNLNGENGDVPISDADRGGHSINDCEAARLKETVNQLKAEKDTHLRKGVRLEMRVVELEHEKESLLLKQACLEGTISQLVSEKTNVIAEQASLKERIEQLMEDKALLSSKHAEFEEKTKYLERDKDLWTSREAKLEDTIKSLELDKESCILKQSSTEEMIGNLRDDNARLQYQVKELEESKIRILQENQMLLENMSGLRVQLENCETMYASTDNVKLQEISEISVLNSQIEAAGNLIEKLVIENADLVEKVNELYTELDRRTPSEIASTRVTPLDTPVAVDESLESERTESTKIYPVQAASNGVHEGILDHSPPITIDSGEIVQIPFSESESQDVEGQQSVDESGESTVELSDAPLTGAPIRFISFVARYVSGADLVDKSPAISRH